MTEPQLPPQDSHLDDEQLTELVDNRPSSTDVRAHLDGCEACRDRYEAQRRMRVLLATPVPPRSAADVSAAIAAALEPANVVAFDPARGRRQRSLRRAGVVSVAALALLGGGFLVQQISEDPSNRLNTASTETNPETSEKSFDGPTAGIQGSSDPNGGPIAGLRTRPKPSGTEVGPTGDEYRLVAMVENAEEVGELRREATPEVLNDPCAPIVTAQPIFLQAVNGVFISYQGDLAVAFFDGGDRVVVASNGECAVLVNTTVPREPTQ